ncbi:Alkyl hydroperoxide reductase AhpD [Actinomyces bovis]|uniref:Alkyl hydroperoxide reductase AhpD n=1 Tax=Actinomyces bovis TaxID=1658 RepID=A0ABY1VQF7_9ACTO|nr:carboxymuconolactone decarboxylase family protein [Actinomyces bovis]SPT54280.1 Alkyl hydroperoxide reductase AhpD [Actinomyces bovis]VEG56394.1 Alkyl hydroperoxide reductase AhpD [Actinomyces israelii]
MTIATLREALPEWAKDLSLNLSALTRSSSLTEQQLWGTILACAAATRNESVLVQVAEEAKQHLSEQAVSAALGAATIMGMNNVAYRTRHFLGDAYTNERMGLRMNIIANNGGVAEKADFELWALAVSSINGCEHCVAAHDANLRQEGLSTEQIWEAVRIAATLQGAAQAVAVVEALG